MNRRVPLKYRNFPGPFAAYRPSVTRPLRVWFWGLYFTALLALALTGVLIGWPLMPYAAVLGAVGMVAYRLSRWRRRLIRFDWLLCTACTYPINLCSSEGRCPECGRAYTHASTRWGWRVLCGVWSDDMEPPPPLPLRD